MNYPTVSIVDTNGFYKSVHKMTEDLEQSLRGHFSFSSITPEMDAPIFPYRLFSCFALPSNDGHVVKGVSHINGRITPVFRVSTNEGWDRAWEMAKAIASMLQPEVSGAPKVTGWQIIRQYRVTRPDVAIEVSLKSDPHYEWDKDDEDPPENEIPCLVVVTASAIRNGTHIVGAAHVNGCYYPSVNSHVAEADGHLPRLVEEALKDLDDQLRKVDR